MMTRRLELALLVGLGLMLGYLFSRMVLPGCGWSCGPAHIEIIQHTAESPYRYRVLTPLVVQALANGINHPQALAGAYSLAHVIVVPGMLMAVWDWLRRIVPRHALLGTVLLGALIPFGYVASYGSIHLYTLVEVTITAAALSILSSKRPSLVWYALLSVIAAANRETGLMLPLLYAAATWRSRGWWWRSALLMVLGGGTYAALRAALGPAAHSVTFDYLLAANLHLDRFLTINVMHNAYLLPFFGGAVLGWRRADQQLRRLAIVTLIYVVFVLIWGIWFEIRLWFPAAPVGLALLGKALE